MKNSSLKKTFIVFEIIIFILFFVLFLSTFLHQITAFTQDLGRHLKIGEIIIQTKKVPPTNLFSSSFPNFPFLNHHWLGEVIFYICFKFIGLNSLIFLKLGLCFLSFFSLVYLVYKKNGSLIAFLWGLVCFFLFSRRTEVRPEIFSFLFLSLYLIILSRKKYFNKFFFILPLIQVPWVNIHIYFFLGPSLIFFYFLNSLFKRNKIKKIFKKVIITTFLVGLACFLNPNFSKGAFYPFNVFKNYGYKIVENQSFFFMNRYFGKIADPYFLLVFFISLLSFILTLKKQSFYSLVSFIFFSILGFQASRNLPLFGLASLFFVSQNLNILKQGFLKKMSIQNLLNLKLGVFFGLIFLLIFLSLGNITNQSRKRKYSYKKFGLGKFKGAEAGADFVIKNNLSGPLFNNFDIGSYLDFRFYPNIRVFVDSRPEAYPTSFFKSTYIPMQEKEEKWDEINNLYNFNLIFFSHSDITPWAINFLSFIPKDPDWQIVFLDDFVIIFLKDNNLNKELIDRYSIKENDFQYNCRGQLDCYARMKRILNNLSWKVKLTL
ncbi:hypothetical protein COT75_00995 [Candidatus Beckwithbacteria bacterium CG10_big_fil_rev_8_21_14_0_10_34_10]|uniref:Glycosyltransferase RgtA/B/C/D-like domain-containing protein n=1 Tax=Candidatus Beckwithbacteria bacterium CG10_big_fil_rev_8_21_14_0_10_34_10 TaxID=1974495 RepID=A0A2H0WA60_9BACT|nr:MAG: hypothetical protein COT75_00995 [Candidatus Beckwithbacteria bacterium CG10_big_fil_rev_8_21_14_0_10_34_10]